MSYILDALKKSEQDRGNGSIPNVQTIHSSALNYHQEKRPLWPWILIVVLISNVFILIYFLMPETKTQNFATENNTAINNISIDSIPTQEPDVKTVPAIIEPDLQQTVAIANANTVDSNTTKKQKVKSIVDIDELPANIRQQIPDMVFSAHVYSSAPMQRSLVINDRFMEEGSAFSHDLILVEITRNGAVFDFRDYRFSTGVLSGWSTH